MIKIPQSLSARRAWIEIRFGKLELVTPAVALRKESVDRNSAITIIFCFPRVSLSARRAWIEIDSEIKYNSRYRKSLSARRAWIEMDMSDNSNKMGTVALRKESVDRNAPNAILAHNGVASLSARRAWIEITMSGKCSIK